VFKLVRQSIGRKVMLVVLATTFAALLATGIALLIYDARTYREAWVNDLATQADILARASAPALAFQDEKTARENLSLLRVRPNILVGAIYTPDGALFARYSQAGVSDVLPARPRKTGYTISGNRLMLYQSIVENGEMLGTVYLVGRYELLDRLADYVKILTAVMVGSLVLAAVIAAWLQRAVTVPIASVTSAARSVIERRDFSRRVQRSTEDEVGVLVDAFNAMLAEVGAHAEALEDTNRTLQHEMGERRSAEEALRVADKRKDEFLATLAHELRNPLAPLRNGLEILRLAGQDPEKAQLVRDMMQRQLNQMVRLVDDLLDVSRITTDRLVIKKEPVSLQAVLRAAIETARPVIESKHHRFTTDILPEPVSLMGDATRLAQVFSNLLNNAARYTPDAGEIHLCAKLARAHIEVTVSDTGIGISPAGLDSIFGMFVQVDQSLERTNAGLGVGLSLAKRLVELHGGKIEAHSEGLGKGSRFTVWLRPAAASVAPVLPEPVKPSPRPSVARRILLADDNVDFVNGFAMILRQQGHEVSVAYDGNGALQAAASFTPEFAFLDIGLPHVNGYDLARRLRDLPATKNSVLTAVTGWGQQADRDRAREAGFDHHLVKPVDFEQIYRILEHTPAVRAKL
jgi:signal transduction histidine kinase/ActR/RegA family two-component response regulator